MKYRNKNNYKQKNIVKTISYKFNNIYIPNRKNQQQVPSHIDTHVSTPTLTLPKIKPNKVDEFLIMFQTKSSKHEDRSISSLDYSSSSTVSHKAIHHRHQLLQTSKIQLNECNISHQSLITPTPSHTRLDHSSSSQQSNKEEIDYSQPTPLPRKRRNTTHVNYNEDSSSNRSITDCI